MSLPRRKRTAEEYLAIDRHSDYKNEYFNGDVFAMTGASRKHNLISLNVASSLNGQLADRDCEVYASDMRVKVRPTGLYTYPDVVVVCGVPQFEDEEVDTLLNPIVIIEVLSKTTEGYDRGDKCEHYRLIESLVEVVLIAQDKYHAEHYARQADNQWLLSETNSLDDVIRLRSINCEISLTDVYRKVSLA
ncbi:MAG TPA: Uma2 family endonuclease [Blastocatellia bacterium]|nr:Uma2 family endonuclease [Blastocatellia bacterium]